MTGKLAGKVALVTGASREIGAAIAEAFTREGADVIRASRSERCDVSRKQDVARLSAAIERLDILVNSAGILTPRARRCEHWLTLTKIR